MHVRLIESHDHGLAGEPPEVRLASVRGNRRDDEVVAGGVSVVAGNQDFGVDGGAGLGNGKAREAAVFAQEDRRDPAGASGGRRPGLVGDIGHHDGCRREARGGRAGGRMASNQHGGGRPDDGGSGGRISFDDEQRIASRGGKRAGSDGVGASWDKGERAKVGGVFVRATGGVFRGGAGERDGHAFVGIVAGDSGCDAGLAGAGFLRSNNDE